MKILGFDVEIGEPNEDGFMVATIPDIKHAYVQGKTEDEVYDRLGDVIKCIIDGERNIRNRR